MNDRSERHQPDEWVEITVNPGSVVICDDCSEDYTHSQVSGGLLFGSYAICPECEQKWVDGAKEHNELHAIRGYCPEGMSFADWVRNYLR
jgi:uncharacterized CHY-type Zn-finger protein